MPSVWAPSRSSGYGSTSVYAEPCSASSPTCGPFPCEITSSCSSASGASALQAIRAFVALVLGRQRLAAPEQRVPAQCDDDPHG